MFQPNRLPSSSRLLALRLSTSALALALAGTLVSPGLAAETVVPGGLTVGNQVLNPGDTLTVEAGGAISTTLTIGVTDTTAGILSIVNNGTIASFAAPAVFVDDSMLNLQNTGIIEGDSKGVQAAHFGVVNNTGSITADQFGLISSAGGLAQLTNSGTITGTNGVGVFADNIGSVRNSKSGSIVGGDIGVAAVTIGSFENNGFVGGLTRGIEIFSDFGSLINTGTIEGGVRSSTGDIGLIHNSGVLSGEQGIYAQNIHSLVNSGRLDGFDYAVRAQHNIASIENRGSIITTDPSHGVAIIAESLGSLTNTGDIGGGWGGINVVNDIGSIVNTGTISAVNENLIARSIGSLDNSGTISGGDHAVSVSTRIGLIRNSGTIIGSAHAIAPTGDLDTLINTGTITSQEETVTLGGTIASLTNSGLINSDNAGAVHAGQVGILQNSGTIRGGIYGIKAAGITSLTNSGTIRAADPTGNAILETGGATDTLLTLNAGSVLIGHVDIHGGTNTLNVGNGLNLALTFDTSVPELIQTNGAPYTIVGNTVYTADIAAFSAAGIATADLTNSIAGAVNGALDKGLDEKGVDGSGHYWLGGVGGFGYNPARNGGSATNSRFGGFALGADFGADDDQRLGFFIGGTKGLIEASASSNNADSFYAGLYGASQFEDFALSGVLTAGYTHSGLSRTVANNTVVGGLETATAGQDAFFIAPSITFTKPWVTDALTLQSSLTFNYTGVFANGFAETGSAGALTMDGGSTHIVEVKALIKAPLKTITERGIWTADLHAGLEGRGVAEAGINGSFAATPVAFAGNNSLTAGLLAGGAAAFEFGGGASIFAGLDGTFRSDQSIGLTANAGLKARF